MYDEAMTGGADSRLGLEKMAADIQQASPLSKLKQRKQQYEQQLQIVNDAIAALEANPEIERVLTLVRRAL